MMGGLSAFGMCGLFIAMMMISYAGGMPGWIGGSLLLAGGWIASALFSQADLSVLIMEAVAGFFMIGFSLRWTLRHKAWQARIQKDRSEIDQKKLQSQGALSQLKEKVTHKATEVDHALKQYEMIKRLAEAVSWEEMAPSLERAIKFFFHAEAWTLYLTNDQGEMQLVHRRGTTPDLRVEDLPRKEATVETFVIPSGVEKGRKTLNLSIPLWRLHDRIGLLVLRLPDMDLSAHSGLLAEANSFATQLIFAMAKAKLYRELDQRSRTDGLTGLSRRGPFEERLKEEVARAQSFKSTFSILMIDIDHFKRLNDTYGHQVGDEVLKTVSQRLREGLYETDLIARYGGEEFVCLLPRSQPAGLRMKAEQLRQRVSGQAFVIGLEAIQVTISVGIAHFPQDGATGQTIMAAADKALYAAKESGRNRVVEAASIAQ